MNKLKDLSIRFADQNDAESISFVLQESFSEYRFLYTPEAYSVTTPDAIQVLKRLKEGPIWVALLNQNVVGTVSVVEKNIGLYIRGMGIIPEARGNKIGWKLLEQVEAFAREKEIKRLFLSSTPFLERAIRLYEKFGFHLSSEDAHELLGTPLFTMDKLIKKGKL